MSDIPQPDRELVTALCRMADALEALAEECTRRAIALCSSTKNPDLREQVGAGTGDRIAQRQDSQ